MSELSVVHVCRSGWPATGGMENAVGGLARAQQLAGHRVWVVTLNTSIADASGEHRGVRFRRLPRVGPRRYPFARGLAGAVEGADLIHVHGVDGLADQILAWPRRGRPPVGISTHGGYLHTPRHRRIKAMWLRTVTRFTFARADAVWFTSESDRRRLAPTRRSGPVLANGVDVDRFAAAVRAPQRGRWLVPGRIDVHKGLDDLMEVLGCIKRSDPRPFRVEFAGQESAPGLRQRLLQLAARNGVADRVRFLGMLSADQMVGAMAEAELVLLPSRYEGFGIAAVEAMAAGAPVVVADIEALRAHVTDDVTGFVARFRDPRAAADRISVVRDRDLVAVGRQAAAAAQEHRWPVRAAQFEAAYRSLLGTT